MSLRREKEAHFPSKMVEETGSFWDGESEKLLERRKGGDEKQLGLDLGCVYSGSKIIAIKPLTYSYLSFSPNTAHIESTGYVSCHDFHGSEPKHVPEPAN